MKTANNQNQNISDNTDIVEAVMRLARTIKRANHGFHHKLDHHHEHSQHHSHPNFPHSRGGLGDIRLMRVISENHSASSRELAEIIDVRPSSLTEMLNRLEERSYVRRLRDEQDSRIIHVELTDEGIAYINDASENHLRLHQKITGCLDPSEQKEFIAYCRRLMEAARDGADN